MCHQTSTVYSCGHEIVRKEPCSQDSANYTGQSSCQTLLVYPPAQRGRDYCLDYWAKQTGTIEVSDNPKGIDDLPRSRKSRYEPSQYTRRLFRKFTPSSDPVKDAGILTWTPQGHRYDPERKNGEKRRAYVGAVIANVSVMSKKATKAQKGKQAPAPVPAKPAAKVKAKGKGKK